MVRKEVDLEERMSANISVGSAERLAMDVTKMMEVILSYGVETMGK